MCPGNRAAYAVSDGLSRLAGAARTGPRLGLGAGAFDVRDMALGPLPDGTQRDQQRSPEAGEGVLDMRGMGGQLRASDAHQLRFAIALFALNTAIPVYAVDVLGLPGWTAGAVILVPRR